MFSTPDPVLAELVKNASAPLERIVRTDQAATALNIYRLRFDRGERIVLLECGHTAKTKNMNKARCHACHRMILEGQDYHRFRFMRD